MITKESLLAALDEPRKIYSLLKAVDPGGSEEELQLILMQMREEDLVKFDIYKGLWSHA